MAGEARSSALGGCRHTLAEVVGLHQAELLTALTVDRGSEAVDDPRPLSRPDGSHRERRDLGQFGRQSPGARSRIVVEAVAETDGLGLGAVDPSSGEEKLERAR